MPALPRFVLLLASLLVLSACASGGTVPSRGRCTADRDCAEAGESCVEGRCAPPTSSLTVELRTDYAPVAEFDGIDVWLDGTMRLSLRAMPLDYADRQRLGTLPEVVSGRREVEVRLMRGADVVAARTVALDVLGDRSVLVPVARSCAARTCPGAGDPASATACDATGCVPPECTPDEPSLCGGSDADAGPGDPGPGSDAPSASDAPAATDAPRAPDAPLASDAGPPADPCAGLTCSGHGWCEAGVCLCDVGYAGGACETCDGSWRAEVGASPVFCRPVSPIDGTEASDPLLDGTAGDDYVRGLGGDDMIRGLDGSDYVNGNMGADTVNGNVGRDEVAGGADDDTVLGGADDDVVIGALGNDTVEGGLGVDRLIGGEGNDALRGNAGDDRYMIDGLGNDRFEDESGIDAARCLPGVRVVSDTMVGADRLLILSSGGRVTIVGNAVERILGCL